MSLQTGAAASLQEPIYLLLLPSKGTELSLLSQYAVATPACEMSCCGGRSAAAVEQRTACRHGQTNAGFKPASASRIALTAALARIQQLAKSQLCPCRKHITCSCYETGLAVGDLTSGAF
jgi:hypothetical protein